MSYDRGFDPGRKGPGQKRSHDSGGVKANEDGTFTVKKRLMDCGVEVEDTIEAEMSHRQECTICPLWNNDNFSVKITETD